MKLLVKQRQTNHQGISLTEILVALVMATMMMSTMVFLYRRMQDTVGPQRLAADKETVGSIGFFVIGRDIRRAGANPVGVHGYDMGVPIPFGVAESQRIRIFADLNADRDIDDVDEDITYEYVDTDPTIPGKDTIRRTTSTGDVTYITNVYDFRLSYLLVRGQEITAPKQLKDIRMARVMLTVATDARDPVTNEVLTHQYENVISMRHFQ